MGGCEQLNGLPRHWWWWHVSFANLWLIYTTVLLK